MSERQRLAIPATEGAARADRPDHALVGRSDRRREEAAEEPDQSGRSRVQLGRLRPRRPGRREIQDQGPLLDRRHTRLGERRTRGEVRADEAGRPAELRDRGREALQRYVRADDGRAGASGGPPLVGLERAQQPGVPRSAVPQGERPLVPSECVLVRAHLQCHLQRRPQRPARSGKGRLWGHRPSRKQSTAQQAGLDLAARLHAGGEEVRSAAL